jgi:phenylpyruvate tautomerase PptA (4-oxalocrotonate tautomerase family)
MPTVIVYWSPGRSASQKEAVATGITEMLVTHGGAHKEDVLVIFQNIESGDAARGGRMLGGPPPLSPNNETA